MPSPDSTYECPLSSEDIRQVVHALAPLIPNADEARSLVEGVIDHFHFSAEDGVDARRLLLIVARTQALHRVAVRGPPPPSRCPRIIGSSPHTIDVRAKVARLGSTDLPILITGETGTGKDLIARALHAASDRALGPFVPVNVAALPDTLAESELFGHVRGAFTGAIEGRRGYFRSAHGGTLFLDEIGEMPPHVQPKLLRALDSSTICGIGSEAAHRIDVRIIAATNKDLQSSLSSGDFRPDLFYRLKGAEIHALPLRARPDDISALAHYFSEDASITPAALKTLTAYRWPGNVRELRNVIETACQLTITGSIDEADLPSCIRANSTPLPPYSSPLIVRLPDIAKLQVLRLIAAVGGEVEVAREALWPTMSHSDMRDTASSSAPSHHKPRYRATDPVTEEAAIRHALTIAEGRVGLTAQLLGMSRQTLWRRMKRYRIGGSSDSDD